MKKKPLLLFLPRNKTSHGLLAHQVPHDVKHFSKKISVFAPKRSKYPTSTLSELMPVRWRPFVPVSPDHDTP